MAPAATLVSSEPAGGANSLSFGRTKDGKKLKIRAYPNFGSLEEERLYRKQHLAASFRVYVFRSWSISQPAAKVPDTASIGSRKEDSMKGLLVICELSIRIRPCEC